MKLSKCFNTISILTIIIVLTINTQKYDSFSLPAIISCRSKSNIIRLVVLEKLQIKFRSIRSSNMENQNVRALRAHRFQYLQWVLLASITARSFLLLNVYFEFIVRKFIVADLFYSTFPQACHDSTKWQILIYTQIPRVHMAALGRNSY